MIKEGLVQRIDELEAENAHLRAELAAARRVVEAAKDMKETYGATGSLDNALAAYDAVGKDGGE